MVEHIYCAYVKKPHTFGKIMLRAFEMKIANRYKTCVETVKARPVARNISTSFFGVDTLNREFKISDHLSVFYSEDFRECLDWLEIKKQILLAEYQEWLKCVKESEIESSITTDKIF